MNNKGQNKLTGSDKLIGIFLFIVAAIVPLICNVSQVAVRSEEYNVLRSGSIVNDVFSHGKASFILTMGVIIALFMLFQILSEDGFTINFKSKAVIFAGIYLIFALVSAIFSKYHKTAFLGLSERYEGFFVLLCYMVFMVVAMAFSSEIKRLNMLIKILLFSGIFLGIIGILQFFGYNIFAAEWFSKLIMGELYNGTPLKIKFDSVFATLYNPNCAGMYYGMMFSMIGVTAVLMPFKNKAKWIFAPVAVVLLICAIGTDSVGGLLGIIVAAVFTAVVCIFYYIFALKSKKAAGFTIGSIAAAVIALIMLFNSNTIIIQKFNIIKEALLGNENLTQSASFYKDVEIDGMLAKLITGDGEYALDYAAEATKLLHNGNVIEPIREEPIKNGEGIEYKYNETGMEWNLRLYPSSTNDIYIAELIGIDAAGTQTRFLFGESEGKLSFLDKFGNPVDINTPVESFGFKGIERLGSNRGYIWSRCIPLLKHNIIIGAGPDCFAFEFPQYDVRSKLNYLGNPYVILDKPHNMFLQTGINTGVISLIVMLILFAYYIIKTIKKVFNDTSPSLNAVRIGIMAGVIAYLVAGMTTDSVVSVAPVFWIMLGAGLGASEISTNK